MGAVARRFAAPSMGSGTSVGMVPLPMGTVTFGAMVGSGTTTVTSAVVVVSTGTGTGTTTEEVAQTSTVTVTVSWAAARAAKAVRRRVAACILAVGLRVGFEGFGSGFRRKILGFSILYGSQERFSECK